MATSQNGWPVVTQNAVVERVIGGAPIVNGWLKGDVDVIFTDLANYLDKNVEASMTPGCWGHNVRKIEGSDDYSNHSSGTAFDYNAPNHPMGKRNTYSEADRNKIRSRLKRYEGVVQWGGDYKNRPDDMHFEIDRGRADVKRVADKIRRESEPEREYVMDTISGEVPRLRKGDHGSWVTRLQRLLNIEDDGEYGPDTAAAVKATMLRAKNVTPSSTDGSKVGAQEWRVFMNLWDAK